MIETILFIALATLVILLGVEIRNYFVKKKRSNPKVTAGVLLEKINTVCKLVSVQGSFKEIVNYQDSKRVFMFPIEKKAIVLVDAIAHVGFDLNKMQLHVEQDKKRITIDHFPEAEVISIDTNIQYYDVKESSFNKFSTQNYTELNQLAKETISEKIKESNLATLAKQQAAEALDLVVYLAKSMGWQLQTNALQTTPKKSLEE